MLRREYTGIFVSINLAEAKEKIRDAAILYDSIPLAWKRKKVTDSKTELEFEDNTGRYRSRLISHPQRPVRGKAADVFLDEFAHYQDQQAIYVSALPVITRGQSVLKIGSTPLGKGSLFHEIVSDFGKYPRVTRRQTHWWDCPDFCKDVAAARERSQTLNTKARVELWGTDKVRVICESMDLDDFQQEYECQFADEESSYFPYELLTPNAKDVDELTTYESYTDLLKNLNGALFAGFDVGRKKDKSEFWIIERIGDRYYDRILKTFDRVPFADQERELMTAMDTLPIIRLGIDQNGIGMQLAESMKAKYSIRVEPTALTNESKETMAVSLHRLLEGKSFWFRNVREVLNQFHSVKKVLLAGGKHRYDAERNEKHHADKVWAAALAIYMALTPKPEPQVRWL